MLSVRQPYAALIVSGAKNIENRSWYTDYRGTLLIHAAKRVPDAVELENVREDYDVSIPRNLEYGAIIGAVTLKEIYEEHDSKWFNGPFGWLLADPIRFDVPIACRGNTGLVFVDGAVRRRVLQVLDNL